MVIVRSELAVSDGDFAFMDPQYRRFWRKYLVLAVAVATCWTACHFSV